MLTEFLFGVVKRVCKLIVRSLYNTVNVLMSLNYTLKVVKMIHFPLYIFCHNKTFLIK